MPLVALVPLRSAGESVECYQTVTNPPDSRMNRAEAIRSLPHQAGSGKKLLPPFPSALVSHPSLRRRSVGRWSLAARPRPPVRAWPSELGKMSIHTTPSSHGRRRSIRGPRSSSSRQARFAAPRRSHGRQRSIRGPRSSWSHRSSAGAQIVPPPSSHYRWRSIRGPSELAWPSEVDSRPPGARAVAWSLYGCRFTSLELICALPNGLFWGAGGAGVGVPGSDEPSGSEPIASAAKHALACNEIHLSKAMLSTNKTLYSKRYRSN